MGSCILLRNSILTACSCLNIVFLIVLRPMTNEPHLRDRVLEAEEVESLGLPLSQFLTLLGRVAAEADQPGLRRLHRQSERAHSFLQVVEESLRLMLMLKADNGVIRIADGNHVAGRVSAPAMGPEI